MKIYSSENIRNVGFVSHGRAGKTSLTEALAFETGATKRLGKADDGNTISDYHPEEIKHKISINTSLIACEWQNTKINILDTPGFSDYFGEVVSALRVADNLVVVVDASSGVEVSTEIIWDLADITKIPRIAFINKMDRENASFYRCLNSMQEVFSQQIVPISLPIGAEDSFTGVVDLIQMKAFKYDKGKSIECVIPKEIESDVEKYRDILIESIAETDDELTVKYLEGEVLSTEDIILGLKKGIISNNIVPVICGSALKNIASDYLLDVIVKYLPSPLDLAQNKNIINETIGSIVFKTIADPYVGKINYLKILQGTLIGDSHYYNSSSNTDEKIGQISTMQGKNQLPVSELRYGDIGAVAKLTNTSTGDTLTFPGSDLKYPRIIFPIPTLTVAIEPKTKVDEDKLGNALHRILDEDPTLKLDNNIETKQTLLTGMGESHLEIIMEKLKNKFGVEVNIIKQRIPYRETIRGSVNRIEAKHKKQSGGAGQYGHVFIDIEPYPDGDLEFNQKIFGGSVPRQYFPAVEKGVREAMDKGILAGYPVINVKVTLVDGTYHAVDSNEMAFKIAGSLAFKKACEKANPILLEPYVDLEVKVPEKYMGDIIGDINAKRGRILSMVPEGKLQCLKASAPMTEFDRYTIDLKSITHGKGTFTSTFSHYEELPAHLAEKIIAESKDK
ncbi:MAG: elongation factor G [Vulcanibacillus sp.]